MDNGAPATAAHAEKLGLNENDPVAPTNNKPDASQAQQLSVLTEEEIFEDPARIDQTAQGFGSPDVHVGDDEGFELMNVEEQHQQLSGGADDSGHGGGEASSSDDDGNDIDCRIVDLALFASRLVVAQRPLLGPALLVAPFGNSS